MVFHHAHHNSLSKHSGSLRQARARVKTKSWRWQHFGSRWTWWCLCSTCCSYHCRRKLPLMGFNWGFNTLHSHHRRRHRKVILASKLRCPRYGSESTETCLLRPHVWPLLLEHYPLLIVGHSSHNCFYSNFQRSRWPCRNSNTDCVTNYFANCLRGKQAGRHFHFHWDYPHWTNLASFVQAGCQTWVEASQLHSKPQ